ncbi:MAG TPA: enoyl-CoA hydratase-related protein [Microthrixaceae bacterium]|nr:enoyl-CoA hydratase-related protein [Microthrixaceae bacterium]
MADSFVNGGVRAERDGDVARVTMCRPERRNALDTSMLVALRDALVAVPDEVTGVVVAGEGPTFSAGHDLRELADSDLDATRTMLEQCRDLMMTIHAMPQVVVARVHALATAAGCQLVAACDLAVAASSAGFAVPGGGGGWFCTTPMVEVGRAVPRKRALEMALTGDVVDAQTAAAWGLVNLVVADADLDEAVDSLLARATRGSAASRAVGKAALYRQLDMGLDEAYGYATDVMAEASQLPAAREMMAAFVEKRAPHY